ncbi:serine/threonine-protein kinase [bacterium]|nr:serine/threonine-protein kinase [bacterium]
MIGKSLLGFEVLESIGKGGMGEVYRARDTKLGRDVALKILPADMVGDLEREGRFKREARALASLQHPNVASVYGFEETGGVHFLVMELVAGQDLSRRLATGRLPVDEARDVAGQIAAGMEAAHENGIVHRDLKPANVMLTPDGEVKILDFGLAQAWFGESPDDPESSSNPTLTAGMTQVGAILGTAAYMAPEQARGSHVDRRADIWAFGVILFEMLTGRQLFQGETVSDTLAAVLRKQPEWELLPREEAPDLCHLVSRCLERNPKQRLRDIGEARVLLQGTADSRTQLSFLAPPDAGDRSTGSRRAVAVGATVAAIIGLLLGGWLATRFLVHEGPLPLLHTMIPAPAGTIYDLRSEAPGPAVLSPDGTMVAFSALEEDGTRRLYIRRLDQGEAVPFAGTESAAYPFWSPDSRSVAFFDEDDGKLRKVPATGGPPITLCQGGNGKGGSWNADGDILFAPVANGGIHHVRATGGTAREIIPLGLEYDSFRHPRFLPDGRHFLFVGRISANSGLCRIFLASLDSTTAPRVVCESESNAEYHDGHLFTVRDNVLVATPFTLDQEGVSEAGIPVVDNILTVPGARAAVFSVSDAGMIVYQTGARDGSGNVLLWEDVETGERAILGAPGQYYHPRISPDGSLAVCEVRDADGIGTDLWLVDLATELKTRFTFAPGSETHAVWSPDGEAVFYTERDASGFRIVRKPVEGTGVGTVVLESPRRILPTSVSPDGRRLLLTWTPENGDDEIRQLPLDDPRGEMTVLVSGPGQSVGTGVYSPDGRWVAFGLFIGTDWQTYVMPAEGGERRWQVSTDGAVYPVWAPDGRRLFLSGTKGDILVYEVDGSGSTFRTGSHRTISTPYSPDPSGKYYDLHPDGRRILQSRGDPAARSETSPLHLVTDWRREAAR